MQFQHRNHASQGVLSISANQLQAHLELGTSSHASNLHPHLAEAGLERYRKKQSTLEWLILQSKLALAGAEPEFYFSTDL